MAITDRLEWSVTEEMIFQGFSFSLSTHNKTENKPTGILTFPHSRSEAEIHKFIQRWIHKFIPGVEFSKSFASPPHSCKTGLRDFPCQPVHYIQPTELKLNNNKTKSNNGKRFVCARHCCDLNILTHAIEAQEAKQYIPHFIDEKNKELEIIIISDGLSYLIQSWDKDLDVLCQHKVKNEVSTIQMSLVTFHFWSTSPRFVTEKTGNNKNTSNSLSMNIPLLVWSSSKP